MRARVGPRGGQQRSSNLRHGLATGRVRHSPEPAENAAPARRSAPAMRRAQPSRTIERPPLTRSSKLDSPPVFSRLLRCGPAYQALESTVVAGPADMHAGRLRVEVDRRLRGSIRPLPHSSRHCCPALFRSLDVGRVETGSGQAILGVRGHDSPSRVPLQVNDPISWRGTPAWHLAVALSP